MQKNSSVRRRVRHVVSPVRLRLSILLIISWVFYYRLSAGGAFAAIGHTLFGGWPQFLRCLLGASSGAVQRGRGESAGLDHIGALRCGSIRIAVLQSFAQGRAVRGLLSGRVFGLQWLRPEPFIWIND